MQSDDLGQFPSPTSSAPPLSDQPAPATTTNSSPVQEPITNIQEPVIAAATFEETPDEIPSVSAQIPTELPSMPPEAVTEAPLEPIMATTTPTPNGGSSFGPFLAIILLLISGVALAVAVFLFSQSQQLKKQLAELTQTLEQQRTTITPTPTPTIIEFPVSAPTPDSTESATITLPTPTATLSALLSPLTPLADATKALKVAINYLPNAQLIIIKTENATSPTLATTKYFFRQDLTTKKYFYVLVAQSKEPEVLDRAIYVTPDNDIPSLNDAVLGNTLGLDLKEALEIAGQACTSQLCTTAAVKAQYIQAGLNRIWQLTFTPAKTSQAPLIIQINAATKEVLFKSTGF